MKRLLLMPTMAMIVLIGAYGTDNSSPKPPAETSAVQPESMKVTLRVKDNVLTASLIDNPTTRGFIALLPLTVKMNDLFGREKYGPLPKTISQDGRRSKTYEIGNIGYWSPGNEIAIFYKNDGKQIPAPGIILIGKMESGEEAFNVPGSVEVTIELSGK